MKRNCEFIVRNLCTSLRKMYKAVEYGTKYDQSHRVFCMKDNVPMSYFHDVPLYASDNKKIFNMVVEIPRWTNAKMEISTKEPLNPIKQDIKKDKVRFVANSFPHHGYIWNYGALPQTWENPDHIDETTNKKGDNDPIDIIEIGSRVARCGQVLQVKILGAIGLIDEDETDWKLISIDVTDPMACDIKDFNDIEIFYPGLLKATLEWFRIYKIPEGKSENVFALNGEILSVDSSLKIIEQVHGFWNDLVSQNIENLHKLSCSTVTLDDAPSKISEDEALAILKKQPKFQDSEVPEEFQDKLEKWFYIHFKP